MPERIIDKDNVFKKKLLLFVILEKLNFKCKFIKVSKIRDLKT